MMLWVMSQKLYRIKRKLKLPEKWRLHHEKALLLLFRSRNLEKSHIETDTLNKIAIKFISKFRIHKKPLEFMGDEAIKIV